MKINSEGLALIKRWEGYHRKLPDGRCQAYLDKLAASRYWSPGYRGLWTIGYGCTEGVTEGLIWTEKQAEDYLMQELAKHERFVRDMVKVPLNSNQFSAVVSLCYNIGPGDLRRSTLLRRLNSGDYNGAANAFGMYRMAGGKVYRGLVRRRADEARLFRKLPPKEIVKNSKKLTFFQRLRMLIPTGLGVGLLSWETLEQVRQFVSDYQGFLVLTFGAVAWITLKWAENRTIKDHREGRYIPSGASEMYDGGGDVVAEAHHRADKEMGEDALDQELEPTTGRVEGDPEFQAMLERIVAEQVAEKLALEEEKVPEKPASKKRATKPRKK